MDTKMLYACRVWFLGGIIAALLVLTAMLMPAHAAPGDISTVAGGYIGDGGPATSARINNPAHIAVSADGTKVYIVDTYNQRIRMVSTTTGTISTVAGNGISAFAGDGGLATAASINEANGVAIDKDGNILIADSFNQRIRKITYPAGTISTIAGMGDLGTGSHNGDNIAATTATLFYPYSVATTTTGITYIADSNNNRLRRIDSDGIISTLAGSSTGTFGGDGLSVYTGLVYLNYPTDVALDSAGNIYIADTNNHRIRKIDISTNIITTVAGNGTAAYTGDGGLATLASLNGPFGVVVDAAGNIYIADTYNSVIRKVNTAGNISTFAGSFYGYTGDGGPATFAAMRFPTGLALDSAGNLYIADQFNDCVRKVTPGGTISTFAGKPENLYDGNPAATAATAVKLNYAHGVGTGPTGNIYIADTKNNIVRMVSATTGSVTTIAGNGAEGSGGDNSAALSAQLNNPYGVTADASGNVYIADSYNHRVRKVTPGGQITTVAGDGTTAILSSPRSVATDTLGNLYIADTDHNQVKKVTFPGGTMTLVAGDGSPAYGGDDVAGGATYARLNTPTGVAVDAAGNVFIADSGNNRIRKVTPGATISTVAGNGTYGFSGDGFSATTAQLAIPYGVAVDAAGNLYIADFYNSKVRMVDKLSGNISTLVGNGIQDYNPWHVATNIFLGFAGDGGPVAPDGYSILNNPYSIAVDPSGNLYIADVNNWRIRKVATSLPPSLSNVHIASNNTNTSRAMTGNTVTLTFTSSQVISAPTVTMAGRTAAVTGGGTSWSASITMTGSDPQGMISFSITYKNLSDVSGPEVHLTTDSSSVTFDSVAPSVTISAPSASAVKSGATVTYTVTYSGADSVTLANANITLNATGATGTVAVSGTGTASRLVTISSITGNGTLGISIAAGTASDLAGNMALTAGPSATFVVDSTAPTLVVSAPSSTLTNTGPVTYTVTYTGADSVTLANANITLNATGGASGTVVVSGSGTASRLVTISSITGNGTLGISIAAGTASDLAGNTAAAAGPSATFSVDSTVPTLVVSAPSSTLTNTGPVTYTVNYTGADSVTLANATLNATGTATGTVVVSGSGTLSRLVTISSITGNGTLGISIAAGTASDLAGNTAAAAGPSTTFGVDNTAPTMVVSAPSASVVRSGMTVTYTVTYTGADSVTLANATLNATGTATGTVVVSGSGTASRFVTISSITGDGTLGISIAAGMASDLAGNTASAAGPSATFVVDNIAPTLVISAPSSTLTNTGPVTYTVNYTGADSVTLANANVTLNATGTATGTVVVSGSGTLSRLVTISSITGNGTLGISIAEDTASDLAGNTADAAGPSATFVVDNIAPTLVVSAPSSTLTNTGPVTYTVTYTGADAVTLANANVTLNTTGSANGIVAVSGAGTASRLVTISGITGNGTLGISIASGTASDLAGNTTAAAGPSAIFSVDNSAPTLAISAPSAAAANTGPVTYTVTYTGADAVTLANANVTLNTTGSASGIVAVSGAGTLSRIVTISGITGNGTLGISLAAGTASDLAGNMALAAGSSATFVVDNIAPTILTLSSTATPTTNTSPIPVTVQFSESVTGFGSAGIAVTNGSVGAFAGSGANYSFSVTPAGNGQVTVTISANAAQDAVGNGNLVSSTLTRIFDSVQPTVTINSSAPNPTNTSPIPVTVTFSKPVADFTSGDVTVSNGNISAFTGSGTDYSFNVAPTGNFTVTVGIAAGVAHDVASNPNLAAVSLTRTYDTVAPTAVISSMAPNSTNLSPIPVTVTFSEAVTGFASGDVVIGNGTIGLFTAVSGTMYTFNVAPTAEGVVTVDIAGGAAQDAAGNNNSAAVQLSRTYDSTQPTVTITSTAPNPTRTSPIPVTVTFSEAVTGFTVNSVSVTNGTKGSFAGSGATYTFNVVPLADGPVTVNVAGDVVFDAAGNGNGAALPLTRTYDTTAPTVAISAPSLSAANNGVPVTYTVTYTGADSVTLANANITLITTGTANGTVVSSGAGTASRTVTISGITGNGTLGISIAAGTASDLAGNNSLAAGPSATFSVDNIAPTLVVSAPSSTVTSTGPVTYTVTYTGADAVTLANANITLNTTGYATGTVVVSGSGTASRTVTISNINGNGTLGIAIAAGTASDLAGNNALAAGPGATFTVDNASGDLNGGGLDMTDALKALRITAGLDTPTASELAHGDVAPLLNGARQPDGKISSADVVAILRKYVGLPSW